MKKCRQEKSSLLKVHDPSVHLYNRPEAGSGPTWPCRKEGPFLPLPGETESGSRTRLPPTASLVLCQLLLHVYFHCTKGLQEERGAGREPW